MKIITSKVLWVSSSFTEKFGSEDIKPAETVLPFMTLAVAMKDTDIKAKVGESTLEDVAAFLTNPPEGANDGYWNIFYVAGYVVLVGWISDDREWGVDAWDLVDGWDAGDRAFGCNWRSDTEASSGALELRSLEARLARVEAVLKHFNLELPGPTL